MLESRIRSGTNRVELGGDARIILDAIWQVIGRSKTTATVTRRQLCGKPTTKTVLEKTHNWPLYTLKQKGFITPANGAWALSPAGREACISLFGK